MADAGGPEGAIGGAAAPGGPPHTRLSAAWTGVVIGVVLLVLLLIFFVQNTHTTRIEFLGARGQVPVAVAMLGAAVVGALAVLAVGLGRTLQLRRAAPAAVSGPATGGRASAPPGPAAGA